MNEIYKKNIEFIKSNNIDLYNKIENHIKDLDIQILQSKDNNKYMQVKKDGKVYNINSKYRPLDEALKWVEGLEIKNNSKIILFGLGIGYRAKYILKKMTSNNELLIIEPSIEIFSEVIKNFDLTYLFSSCNVKLLIAEEENVVKKYIRDFAVWRNVKHIIVGIIPNYNNIYDDLFNKYTKTIKEEIDCQLINYQTGQHLAKVWYKNFISNIPSILNSYKINDLKDKFKDKPVIIVSAGPSLNKNVKLLKKVKDRALIICVGTALKVLKREGITPHIVVTLDGEIENYYHFQNIDFSNILLLYLPIVYPQILREHKGEKVVCINYLPYLGEELFNVLGDINMLEVGGSVAHAAFSLAREMNANPIVFIGQDLAYGAQKQTHAKGTSFDEGKVEHKVDKFEENLMMVEDKYGKEILTDKMLFSFLKWFECKIEEDESERIYIDATEGGAKINGTKIMTLQETIDKYMKESIEKEINSIINLKSSEKIYNKCNVNSIINDLGELSKKIEKWNKDFEEGLEKIDRLKDSYMNDVILENESELIKDINEINRSFIKDTESSKFLSYVLYFATYKIDENDFAEFDYSIKKKKYIAISNQGYLFKTAKDLINDLLEVVKESISELESIDFN